MTLVPSGVTDRIIDEDDGSPGGSSWIPRWLRRQREADELSRWVSQVARQWADTMEGAQLAERNMNVAKLFVTAAPQVESVDPGPPVTLLVRMLPGQSVDDFQANDERIAAGMEAAAVEITPFDDGLINVVLLDHDPHSAVEPPPA